MDPPEVDLNPDGVEEEKQDDSQSFSEASSIQIAPTQSLLNDDDDDPMLRIELGDNLRIISGQFGKVDGTVYYRSLDLIRIKPIGVSNTLISIPVEQTDDSEEFDEDSKIEEIIMVDKRTFPAFVLQQDFQVGQLIDTFDSEGKMYKRYQISAVNKENDYISIMEMVDGEADETTKYDLEFRFIGIDPDEPFQVISIFKYDLPSANEIPNESISSAIAVGSVEEDIEQGPPPSTEEDDFEYIGQVEIVLPKVIREISSYEQVIPDEVQKVDALNDHINNLDLSVQKNPKIIRSTRMLIETLDQLKRDTISYYSDGSVRGPKKVSAFTLSDLIDMTTIPLGRPVLDVVKKGYVVGNDENELLHDTNEFYFTDYNDEFEEKNKFITSNISDPFQSSIIREWSNQKKYLQTFLSPWSSNGKEEPIWSALSDSEFFRISPPEFEDEEQPTSRLLPTIEGYRASHKDDKPPIFSKVPFGMERALGVTYRKGEDRRKQILMDQEKAPLSSYLLFPFHVAPYLGSKRTFSIAVDSGRSQLPIQTMYSILSKLGPAKQSGGTSNDIILIDTTAQSYGHIMIENYIDGLDIPATGLGDTYYVLNQYGLADLELNEKIVSVLETKISMYQQQLLSSLASFREVVRSMENIPPLPNSMIQTPNFLSVIKSQPILLKSIEEYERFNPSLASFDLGIVNHLMKYHNNYFQVVAGNHPYYSTKAFYEENKKQYHEQMKTNQLIKWNQKNAGKPPKRNRCKHVADMVSVRKIRDDEERFYHLTRVFRMYQGTKQDNWYHCNLCKEAFLCIHERLQLQAYLNPAEKSIIEKEIILKCSGGQFQGNYICRNCGQSIRELDLDNNVEFDDEGRPKSGRAVLEDQDALLEEKIDLLIKTPIDPSEQELIKLPSQLEKDTYQVLRELSERVGVEVDRAGYEFMIEQIRLIMSKFPNEALYGNLRKKNPNIPEYKVARPRRIVALCATFLLTEVQTKIPSYTIRYALKGCPNPGFDGYPLNEEKEKVQGLEYIICAIRTLHRNDDYFYKSGFHAMPDPSKIVAYLQDIIENDLLKLPIVQSKLTTKRAYNESIQSESSVSMVMGPRDEIPATFLPEQVILSAEDAAKDVILPEVAKHMDSKGRTSLVKLWIRQAHRIAMKHANLVRGMPFSETSCCFHAIQSASDFWKDESLPPLWNREIMPYRQGQPLVTEFIARDMDMGVVQPNQDVFYRIFLKYCFQGPRIGHPHQPGLTNRCTWCKFQFRTHPKIMSTQEGKDSMSDHPDVDTSEKGFIELLDEIHKVNRVESIPPFDLSSVEAVMNQFAEIQPEPLPNWSAVMKETTQRFLTMPKNADRSDLVAALSAISNATADSQGKLQKYLSMRGSNKNIYLVLDQIAGLSWMNFFQVIQTYFITTIQRLLSSYSDKTLTIPVELVKELSENHVQKFLNPLLEDEMKTVKDHLSALHKPEYIFARAKLSYFLKQLREILKFKNKIRSTLVPGRGQTLAYIQQTILYGTLATLMDPDFIPNELMNENPEMSTGSSSTTFIGKLLVSILTKYKSESLTYDDEKIKTKIAILEEMERVSVIQEFNKLSEDERRSQLMQKRLGIGRWAVGGTSLTWKYDADYFDLESQRREEARLGHHPVNKGGEGYSVGQEDGEE